MTTKTVLICAKTAKQIYKTANITYFDVFTDCFAVLTIRLLWYMSVICETAKPDNETAKQIYKTAKLLEFDVFTDYFAVLTTKAALIYAKTAKQDAKTAKSQTPHAARLTGQTVVCITAHASPHNKMRDPARSGVSHIMSAIATHVAGTCAISSGAVRSTEQTGAS